MTKSLYNDNYDGEDEEDTISGYGHVMNEMAGTVEVHSQMEGRTKDIMLSNDMTCGVGKLICHHLVIPTCAFTLDETMP